MAAAHRGGERHREAGVVHVDERKDKAHRQVQRQDEVERRRVKPGRQQQPAGDDEQPAQQADANDRLAAELVDAGAKEPQRGEPTEEREAGQQQDRAVGHRGGGLEIRDGERAYAAVGHRPPDDVDQQPAEGRISGEFEPRHGLI